MSVKIIFEDHPDSAISVLLTDIFGDNVIFCETCDLISRKAIIYSGTVDLVVCYFDCPPDNIAAMLSYRACIVVTSKYNNIVVLKSQCIEHYMLKCLYDLGVIDNSIVREYFNSMERGSLVYNDLSYEKYCKRVLGNSGMRCTINKVINRYTDKTWYNKNCCISSNGKIPNKCSSKSLLQKKLAVMMYLPYCPIYYVPMQFRKYFREKTISDVMLMCKEEFDVIDSSIKKEVGETT